MESHNIPGAGTSRRSARLPRRCPAARSKLGKAGSRHAEFWRSSLRDYTFPKIGHKRVNQITTADVMSILLPIWNEKRSTAQRVRQRTGAVMEWAVAQGYREGNPPRRRHLGGASPETEGRPVHHRALPHASVGEALSKVRGSRAMPATKLAMELLALMAARSGEVQGARWSEFDLVN